MITTILIIVLALLILCSALFSGSETAFFSLSSFELKSYHRSKDPRRKMIYNLLEKPRELLVTIMMLNVMANILVQNVVSSIFGTFSSWLLTVGLPLVLTLILGEVIPKSIALPNNRFVTYAVVPLISKVAHFLGPVRIFLTRTTSYISRFIFFFLKKEKEISLDELEHGLKTSKDRGVLQMDESELIKGYLDLHNSIVKEVMRPREEVVYYDIHQPLSRLTSYFVDQECSRVPVCDGDLENLIGIISTRRFFFHREQINQADDLKKIAKQPFYIPESSNAFSALTLLREKKENFAIVVDEYGSISGLLTQEDLIESVVGEIADRRDMKSRYTRSSEDVIIASGKLELDEIEELFGEELESDVNSVTIGGWLTEKMGDIPQAGAKYMTDSFLFYVLSADPNRVRRVYIRHVKAQKRKKR